jgi:hypothetical protein
MTAQFVGLMIIIFLVPRQKELKMEEQFLLKFGQDSLPKQKMQYIIAPDNG